MPIEMRGLQIIAVLIYMETSIIIRSYNEEQYIGRLLSGIFEQNFGDVEVVLVDSGSTDATLSIASQFGVRIVSIAKKDFSFGRSLNLGCEAAEGEFLVFASAHVYPLYRDWLERLLEPFENEKVALVYGKQRGGETTKFSEHRIFRQWFSDESNFNQPHPFCNNANAAVRRSCWQQLRYDETLTGLEDLDWAQRAVKNGWRIAYSADAVIAHVHNESWPGVFNRYCREAMAMKAIYPAERFSVIDFARLFLVNSFSDYKSAVRKRAFFKNIMNICLFRLMQFWGTYRGYSAKNGVSAALRQKFYYPNGVIEGVGRVSEVRQKSLIDYSLTAAERECG